MKLSPLAISTTFLVLAVQSADAQTTPLPAQQTPPQAVAPAPTPPAASSTAPAAAPPAAGAPTATTPAAPAPTAAAPAAPAAATSTAAAPSAAAPAAATPTAPTPPAEKPLSIVYSIVNLRQGPGTTYSVIDKIPAGGRITLGSCSDGWCQASWQGKDGYIIATSLAKTSLAKRSPHYGPPPVYAGPPVYYGPRPYNYDYGPGPYYYGYGPYWRRWRYW